MLGMYKVKAIFPECSSKFWILKEFLPQYNLFPLAQSDWQRHTALWLYYRFRSLWALWVTLMNEVRGPVHIHITHEQLSSEWKVCVCVLMCDGEWWSCVPVLAEQITSARCQMEDGKASSHLWDWERLLNRSRLSMLLAVSSAPALMGTVNRLQR